MNTTPTSADAPATRSKPSERRRDSKYDADATAVVMNARYATHADGTCTYMMRTDSPCVASGGVAKSPPKITHASVTTAITPTNRVVGVPTPFVAWVVGEKDMALNHSSISAGKDNRPAMANATANTKRRPTHGQPSLTRAPAVPYAASVARAAPITIGATTGRTSSGNSVSRPFDIAASPP